MRNKVRAGNLRYRLDSSLSDNRRDITNIIFDYIL